MHLFLLCVNGGLFCGMRDLGDVGPGNASKNLVSFKIFQEFELS